VSDLCNLTVIQNLPLFDRPVLQVTLTFDYPSKKDKKKGLTPKPPKVNSVIKDITLRHG